jgi:hypothetical protein
LFPLCQRGRSLKANFFSAKRSSHEIQIEKDGDLRQRTLNGQVALRLEIFEYVPSLTKRGRGDLGKNNECIQQHLNI